LAIKKIYDASMVHKGPPVNQFHFKHSNVHPLMDVRTLHIVVEASQRSPAIPFSQGAIARH
jgi:hypothetical protein